MVVLNFFVTTAALPSLATDLHANTAALQWISAGYGLAFAAGLITSARLGDLYGRRKVFVWGLIVFTAASAACAAAPTIGILNGTRIAQGIGAALMGPQVLAFFSAMFTGHAHRRAVAWQNTVVGAASIGGQIIGGLLITANIAGLGWRSVFVINVPLGLIAIVLALRWVPESRAANAGRGLDVAGTLMTVLGLVGVVLALVQGRETGWPLWSFVVLVAAMLALVIFVRHQRIRTKRGRTPLLDLAVFRYSGFSSGLGGIGVLYAVTGVMSVVLSLYLQQVKGLTVLEAGGMFAVLNVGFLLTSTRQAKLTTRHGVKVAVWGALILAIGYAVLAVSGTTGGTHGWLIMAAGLILAGAGQALANGALTSSVTATVEGHHAGATAGVLMTVQEAAGPVGVALLGVVYFATWGGFTAALAAMSLAALVSAVFARQHARAVNAPDAPDGSEAPGAPDAPGGSAGGRA
ncbi:hypothetical protein BIV57_17770 [Mangrovactinospora gilvigrisea]|uniref:Major facilitator superfamily (MFS) profile domain-containing protein n=2 Tax=Mangrovactinospora gilvigrisea TaxID=1428644 RepID=A0A1J7BRT0_9ACTN|nr:hypothetical protein BIV57_17770 [Mangrovactinospora gilvigrisea]